MELGATVCTPRKPRCLLCPLRESCRAFAAGDAESFPPKKAKKQWVSVRERAVCAVDERGWVLLAKRAAGQWRAGLWDLPESWDAASAAAGVTPAMPAVIEELGEVETRHVVTRHKITRATQVVRVESGRHSAGVAAGAGRNSASGVAGRKKSAQLQAAEPTPVSMPVRAAASASAQAAETHHSANGAELRWVDVERTELALGSAFKKTWQTIRERFPEVSR
jgi:adenine-specific DNA glycosylase